MNRRIASFWLVAASFGLSLTMPSLSRAEDHALLLPSNMKELHCEMPEASNRLMSSNAAGQIFLPGEAVDLTLALKKDANPDYTIEIQEITTRDPSRVIEGMEGFTDTAGHAPLIGLEGKPVSHAFKAAFGDGDESKIEVKNLPLPAKFGTYALVLAHGGKRQFLGTLCRVVKPRADGNLETTPLFGEFQMFDRRELYAQRAETNRRMGVRGMRAELSWNETPDGKVNWENYDEIFRNAEQAGIQLMVTLGGQQSWTWPFSPQQTPAAVRPEWDGSPYWAQADWLADPKLYPRYGQWITTFCQRYWKDGKGALWGLENYNEPWEGGGISGWARDSAQYRELQKLIAESARKVDPRIQICAASSIMNTEDKLFADGSRDFDKYLDVFTDHYVLPSMCYGPMVAAAHGKKSVETETWFVNAEYLLPQVVQFLAAGQGRLSAWHPRVLFDRVPGVDDNYFIPTPVVAATAAFNQFITGKQFEKVAFLDHLPWVFQFGKDTDKDGLLILFGQLMSIGSTDPKDRVWSQVENSTGGTLTIDNADGLLKFYDLAGNPAYEGQKSITVPLSIFPLYVTSPQGPAAAVARLKTSKIEGKRPVEIIPRDFTTRVDRPGAKLVVSLHNCLNRDFEGTLEARAPEGLKLAAANQAVKLKAGETRDVTFDVASAQANPANAYAFEFAFKSPAGAAEYAEVLNAAIAPKGTKTIDGNLDDWRDVPGITILAQTNKAETTENLRRPWLELKDKLPDGGFAEFKLAWDDKFLYVAAQVKDKTPQTDATPMATRDDNYFFHSSASDAREPYKAWLAKNAPGRSFAEVPYVYARSPEAGIPFRRDRLHLALDVSDDWHDLQPTTDRVPLGFHAVPDTDYEYSLHFCQGGQSECWRLLAPGVPRRHDFPRTLKGERSTGAVPGAQHVVKLDGQTYIYELALPREELKDLQLAAGTNFGLMVRAGNNEGPHVDYGTAKAATKSNGLSLHPYWERSPNCGVRWTLAD